MTIKKAYKAKALALHPDKNPHGASSKQDFQELAAAFERLYGCCDTYTRKRNKQEPYRVLIVVSKT